MRQFFRVDPQEFASLASLAFDSGKELDTSVLTAMEFYAAARIERSNTAKFIALMTSLEAMSNQADYGEEIGKELERLAEQIGEWSLLAGDEKIALKSSLMQRVKGLRRESVRQSILRMVKQYIKSKEDIKFLDDAYAARSRLLHEGERVSGLDAMTHRLESIIRQIFSELFGLPLATF